MRKLKDLICAAAFVALTAISVWGAVQVYRTPMPDASTLEPLNLRQLLTEEDLSQASPAVRSRVVRRFDDLLRSGRQEWLAEWTNVKGPQRDRLEQNLSVLMERWFREQTERYFDQPVERREAWLDGEFRRLQRVFGGGNRRGRPRDLATSLYVLGVIGNHMEQWIQRADPEMQPKMREFQRACQQRILELSFPPGRSP